MRYSSIAVTGTLAVACCLAATAGAPSPVMTILGLGLLGSSGYVWSHVVAGSHVAGLERFLISLGLSFALPVLGGLALHAAGVPLHRASWLGLEAGVTLCGDLALFARQRAHRRMAPVNRSTAPRMLGRHILGFGGAIAIAVAGVALATAGAAAQHQPGFTQFWLVPQSGRAPTTANLGVRNHEARTVRYRIVVVGDARPAQTWTMSLVDGQSWHKQVRVDRRQTTAELYRVPDMGRPYMRVQIRSAMDRGS